MLHAFVLLQAMLAEQPVPEQLAEPAAIEHCARFVLCFAELELRQLVLLAHFVLATLVVLRHVFVVVPTINSAMPELELVQTLAEHV